MKRMLALGALALAMSLAQAQGYGPGMGYGMGPGMSGGGNGHGYGPGAMFSRLNLTDEQQDKVFAIQEQHRSKNFGTMTKMRAESYKLQKMVNAEPVDTKSVVEQQKKVDDLRREMLASRLEMRNEVDKVLTPEQRKQFKQFGPWWSREEVE